MNSLRELYIIDIPVLEQLMCILCKSIQKHKTLQLLNIKQTTFRTRDISALVAVLSGETVLTKIDISTAIISQQNMSHLWVSLHYNISVTELDYSRINFLAIETMRAVDAELLLNRTIRDSIMPQVERRLKENVNASKKELCLRGVMFSKAFFPAVVKYIKLQRGIEKLDLSMT